MNTREINGTSWRLKYYFIAAIPLALATILIPLIYLSTFHFVSRHLAAHRSLRTILHWSWVLITFVIIIVTDGVMLPPVRHHGITFVMSPSQLIMLFILTCYTCSFFKEYGRCCDNAERKELQIKRRWWITFSGFSLLCIVASFFLPFVELLPYFVYFIYVWYRQRRKTQGMQR
jgi:hypothetical protein